MSPITLKSSQHGTIMYSKIERYFPPKLICFPKDDSINNHIGQNVVMKIQNETNIDRDTLNQDFPFLL